MIYDLSKLYVYYTIMVTIDDFKYVLARWEEYKILNFYNIIVPYNAHKFICILYIRVRKYTL